MKRNLAKIISVLLVLVVSLSGCANEKSAVLGTWKADVNLADYVNEEMADVDETIAEYLSVDSFNMTMVLTFNDDNTYSLGLDESNLDTTMAKFKQDIRAGLEQYLLDMAEQVGLEMTIDEIMETSGTTMDELIEEAFPDEMMQEIVDSSRREGNFKVKGGKMYFSAGLDYAVDENVFGHYELKGSQLTLIDYPDEDEEFLRMYPLTFTKAG